LEAGQQLQRLYLQHEGKADEAPTGTSDQNKTLLEKAGAAAGIAVTQAGEDTKKHEKI